LQELGVRVLDCEHKTPPDEGSGHPYLAIPNIVDGRIELTGVRRIGDRALQEWTRRTSPRPRDVVVTRRGRVGDTAAIPEDMRCAIGQNLVLLRTGTDEIDQRYLRWATTGPFWRAEVDRMRNVGAVFDSLNVGDIPRLRIPVPPLPQQRAIAAVLDTLDDKIESNRRGGRLLSSITSERYRSLRAQPSATTTTFGDFADVYGGSTPPTSAAQYWDGQYAWATPTDVSALDQPYLFGTARTISDAALADCNLALHPSGSIFMTSRAGIGAFAVNQVPCATNQGFITVRPRNDEHRWLLFEDMRARVPEMLAWANGSTFLELSRGNFKRLQLQVPSLPELRRFHEDVDPLHARAAQYVRENGRLAALRDALLPELLSGQMRVPEARDAVAPALA
jgi:type I restriction enzyme S subunit